MPATEKDLAVDAPWKKIQQNTFTRWTNEHLKCVNKQLVDLQVDLGDGLKLIALLEVLSQKKMFRKYHSRPNFRQMKLENVSVALEFLEKENIKLVSIGARSLGRTWPSGLVRPMYGRGLTSNQRVINKLSELTRIVQRKHNKHYHKSHRPFWNRVSASL
nr:filamin-C-like isoform X1 [Labrus bergylta]